MILDIHPLPWKVQSKVFIYDATGKQVVSIITGRANANQVAEFIVRAVNRYEPLVAVVDEIRAREK